MWKSKSEKADAVFGTYTLLILGIEFFVYDMRHISAVTRPILDLVLG